MSTHDIDRHPTDEELEAIARLRVRLGRALHEEPDPLRSGWRGWFGLGFAGAALPPWAAAGAVLALLAIVLPAGVLPAGRWGTRDAARAPIIDRVTDRLADRANDGVRPSIELTPGAASTVRATDLCAGRGVSREVSPDVRLAVLREYGMEDVPADEYELDALITPELGGTTDARNLWPQRYASAVWHARVKDELEHRLAADVCAGRVALEQAQRDIATDWIAAYRRYFRSELPLRAHNERLVDEEPELVIRAPRQPRVGAYAEAMARISLAMMRPS